MGVTSGSQEQWAAIAVLKLTLDKSIKVWYTGVYQSVTRKGQRSVAKPHITKGRYIVEVNINGKWVQKWRTDDKAEADGMKTDLEIIPGRAAHVIDTQK